MATVKETTVMKAIREEVAANGLRATARRIGCDPSHLKRVLDGERPIGETVADAFGFEVEEITITRVIYRRKASAAQVA